eukprot:TRINITY_DN6958_c0_g1_i3.p2 TRINITY_DN6958_c0_g1~~TRINITY_DN6958_c0_g1_i3.p2  ORF type:complete len:107 (+),score=1.40 TRINITY_DN6958_c0_g1_i3:23-322(+)
MATIQRSLLLARPLQAAFRAYSKSTNPNLVQYNTGDGYLDFDHRQCNHLEVDGHGKLAVIFGGFGFTKRQVCEALRPFIRLCLASIPHPRTLNRLKSVS